MGNNQKKNPTTHFLICSFIGLLIFSIIIFSLLGIYMSRKSKQAVYDIGKIYMSGMNEQDVYKRQGKVNPHYLFQMPLLLHYLVFILKQQACIIAAGCFTAYGN